MLYHQPDNRWPVFGCPDYDTYLKNYLVKGLFHAKVPEAIKKEYETIEQLMAHAWYHYSMYDEAMNKLLRTFELAIKLKCGEICIPIDYTNKKGEKKKIILAELIKEINKVETGKRLSIFLDHLRDLRNISMHPNENSFMGGMHREKIILTINILNVLFSDEQLHVKLEQRRGELRQELSLFNQKVLGFERGKDRILAHNLSFIDVFMNSDDEILLFGIDPVARFKEGIKPQNQWARPFFVEIKNPLVKPEYISGHDLLSDSPVTIFMNKHPDDLLKVENFRNSIYKITLPGSELDFPEAKYNPQLTFSMQEKGSEMQRFRYRYFQYL